METLGDKNQLKLSQKSATRFYCEKCQYGTSKKSNFDMHLLSDKHSKVTIGYKMGQNSAKIQPELSLPIEEFRCEFCDRQYQHRQGLWRHQKTCHIKEKQKREEKEKEKEEDESFEDTINSKSLTKDELILMLIKENKEFKAMLMEQQTMMMKVLENGTHNTTNNNTTHTNSHNKAFNLQFFLNETCKDAMNIMDFVDSIKLQLSDLEKIGEVGYTQGISNIITSNLKALDVTQRPVHCVDKKRETMYIKDENKWEKEDDNNSKLRKMIKRVANKNIRLLPQFREKYPDYSNSSLKISDKYDKIVLEAMGGAGNNDLEKEDKIIHNISKVATIDKYSG